MSAHIEVTIKAMNAHNQVTTNFKENNTAYYENPIEVNITIPTEVHFADGTDMNMTHQEHNISKSLLGFGGTDSNGTHSIAWNETNQSQQIRFNYDRDYNNPINPFEINGSAVTITATSVYTSSSGNSASITGTSTASQKATFVYGRAVSTKFLYDDVTTPSIQTPIMVQVYCHQWPASSALCPGVDVNSAATNESSWFLSTQHDMAQGDGNVTLRATYGSIAPTHASINTGDNGTDTAITVSGTAPTIVDIDFDTTNPTNTNTWLMYNKDTNTPPSPFYRVRFIGSGGWTGTGKTGHVVGDDIHSKKTQRTEW
jgi:hypothetical protein